MIEYEFGYNNRFPFEVEDIRIPEITNDVISEKYDFSDNSFLIRTKDDKLIYIETYKNNFYISSTNKYSTSVSADGKVVTIVFN